jgi:hypothetical protein
MVDEATVRTWLAEVTERIRTNTEEVARLRAEIGADTRRQAALEGLLAASTDGSSVPQALAAQEPSARIAGRRLEGVSLHPIEQGAIEVLGERSKPLHISELRAELARRGIPIPGKGTDANVIVYLSRCNDICRVGRGLYALRTWNVPEVPARRRRSVRKRRKVRA